MRKIDKSRLLHNWDRLCIVCGLEFLNYECITREHIISVSNGGTRSGSNIAPAHYNCNQLKGNGPLIQAMRMANAIKNELGEDRFYKWTCESNLVTNE